MFGEVVPDAARGGVPPLQRLGALRGRSPCFACPVRPRGRLPLGLVIEGAGRWLASRARSPQSGVYEDGLGLSFVRSLPEFGVGRVSQVKNGWRIRSGTANTPPKHTTLHKTMQSARNQPSRKVPVTSIAHHGRRRQKNGSLCPFDTHNAPSYRHTKAHAMRSSGSLFGRAPTPVPLRKQFGVVASRW